MTPRGSGGEKTLREERSCKLLCVTQKSEGRPGMEPLNQPEHLHALPLLFAAGSQSGSDLAHARETGLPVCMRVQTRSLSSLPRTLLRLISYSVAGYNLVMVNSVTVLGTTELSSRPTKEEQKSQLTLSRITHQHSSWYSLHRSSQQHLVRKH